MTVIVVVNSKGGVGKTTAAINLAEAFRLASRSTLLIDCDPSQGSSSRWRRVAEDNGKDAVATVKAEVGVAKLVRDFKRAYEVIVIDGPANLENANSAIISVADLVIIPIQSSQLDLWACESALDWIQERRYLTGGLPEARFLLSRSHPQQKVASKEQEKLVTTGVPVFTSRLVNRVNYARTIGAGGSVFDLPASDKARVDVESLFTEVENVCNNLS